MNISRSILPTIFLLTTLFCGNLVAQDISIDREKSRLWIEGSSNVNTFQCQAERYTTQIEPPTPDSAIDVEVDISVEGFECGKRRMNRDLYETLQSEAFPNISFEYIAADSLTYMDENDRYTMVVTGYLSVAGTQKEIRFPMDATLSEDGIVQATGKTTLRMTEYNVEPPRALLGLVRVEDELTVHFELFASTSNVETLPDGENQK